MNKKSGQIVRFFHGLDVMEYGKKIIFGIHMPGIRVIE